MDILDLYCGVGGASRGYQLAGHTVYGVDIAPQPDYCGDGFMQKDITELTSEYLSNFDFVHLSPPCQASSALTKGTNQGRQYEQLIPWSRQLAFESGVPFVLENVQGSDLRRDVTLCGEMFGLAVLRHRYFEFGNMTPPPKPMHMPHRGRVRGWRHGTYHNGPYLAVYGEGGGKGSVAEWQAAMGIDWTSNRVSIAEAIPPAYSQWIGIRLRV